MRGLAASSFWAGVRCERPVNDFHICGQMIREDPKHQQSIQLIVFDLEVRQ